MSVARENHVKTGKAGVFGAAVVLVLAILFLDGCGGAGTKAAPAWIKEGRPIQFEAIPEADYPFLSDWLARKAKPADAELEKLTTAPEYDPDALLNFARSQVAHEWNSKEHWDLIEAVRKLNASLPPDAERMRFVGIDKVIDWPDVYIKIRTLAKDSPEMKALNEIEQKRDVEMAENAERKILAKGIKGLLFVGRGHDETHFGGPPDKPYRRPIMGKVLYDKYGNRVYQVAPDWGRFPALGKSLAPAQKLPIAFDMPSAPFASILVSEMGPEPVKMENLARGYVYFGPAERLHRNTAIVGFVTEEMFAKYKNYYEIDLGRSFLSAQEVDEFLQENRWSQPGL
jgi:hypothetical protein